MEWLIENWFLIITAIAMIAVIVKMFVGFNEKPTEEQIRQVQEWLLYAVVVAEQHLGDGTGQLKLRQVYDMFLTKFPWIAKLITFSYFSELVDEALIRMKEMLESNKIVKHMVECDGDFIVEIDNKGVLKNE